MSNKPSQVGDIVTPVGNAWIIIRSKSHPGRIYYFNTLTGKAVWNLSDSDIIKAEQTTKILQKEHGTNVQNFPEPPEPPSDTNHHLCDKVNQPLQQPNFDKQVVNNLFQTPAIGMNPFPGSQQCVNCVQHTINSYNNVNTINHSLLASATSNSQIWAVPPNHQIFIHPTQSPIVNQTQTSVNVAYNSIDRENKDACVTLSSHPRNTYNFNPNFNNRYSKFGRNRFQGQGNYDSRFKPRGSFHNKFKWSNHHNRDLRQKIHMKRNINTSEQNLYEDNYSQDLSYNNKNEQMIKIIKKPTIEDICPADDDDKWLKEHAFVQGTQLKLNIEPLKKMVMSNPSMSCWYIVIDTSVLLKHYNLINIIVISDEQCQLMVRKNTIDELRNISGGTNNALIVLKLLTQQFAANRAVLGVDSGSSNHCDIIDFILKLAKQNNNVVLISDNTNVKPDRNNSINVFTISDVKDILMNKYSKPKLDSRKSPITVTITNNVQNINEESNESFIPDIVLNKVVSININENDIAALSNNFKKTIETGVQTDSTVAIKSVNRIQTITHTQGDPMPNKSNNEDVPKRRSLRLNRNNSQSPTFLNKRNTDRKQFIWHRKKNISIGTEDQQDEQESNNVANKMPPLNEQVVSTVGNNIRPQVEQSANNGASDVSVNSNKERNDLLEYFSTDDCENDYEYDGGQEDNFSSSTYSSSIMPKNKTNGITIEETSTSGNINSSSSSDSECEERTKLPVDTNTANNDNNKCVMFEIENHVMEDNLRLKSEEWVSRFVQLMEEILSVILEMEPRFVCNDLPPPWTLHEATECIRKKYSTDPDVEDAASKLSLVIHKISDSKGKINVRLEPSDFMELYSYGVYLIDSLQTLHDNEDLQITQETLTKLLSDIQEPVSNIQNDSLSDFNNEFSANVTPSSTADTVFKDGTNSIASSIRKEDDKPTLSQSTNETSSSKSRYDLRSTKKKPDEDMKEMPAVKFIRNVDKESTFFFTLNLKRNNDTSENRATPENVVSNISETLESAPNEDTSNDVPGPRIIRNFSKCLEFEERLKNSETDTNSFGYSDENYEYDDFYTDSNYYGFEADDYDANDDTNQNIEDYDNSKGSLTEHLAYDLTDFKCFTGKIVYDLKETLTQVKLFCENTRKELNSSKTLSLPRIRQIQLQADKAYIQMSQLQSSLKNILSREDSPDNNNNNNLQTIFKQAGVVIDSELSSQYRSMILKCLDQSTILLDALNIVIQEMK